jgi:hypothetical protein
MAIGMIKGVKDGFVGVDEAFAPGAAEALRHL